MKNDPNTPWITRQFARLLEDPKTLKERNDKHVTESMRQAQAKLFLETAERPEINKHLGGGRYVSLWFFSRPFQALRVSLWTGI